MQYVGRNEDESSCNKSGPTRSTRSKPKKQAPYPQQTQDHLQPEAQAKDTERLRDMLRKPPARIYRKDPARCSRGAVNYSAAPAGSSHRPWEWKLLAEPAQSLESKIPRFLSLLTGNLTEQRLLNCCKDLLSEVASTTLGSPYVATKLEQPLSVFTENCSMAIKRNTASDFWSMVRMIQLVCKCNRYLIVHFVRYWVYSYLIATC